MSQVPDPDAPCGRGGAARELTSVAEPAAPIPVDALPAPARSWYQRPALAVAADLLGALLTVRSTAGDVTVRLTEVEAYDGENDPGSHAFRGRTARNAVMFGEPGRIYVYRHLGLHHCMNIVTGPAGQPSAVLLRAGEVVDGVHLARSRRAAAGVVDSDRQIARGPARLTVALGVDLTANGADVTEPEGDLVLRLRPDDSRPPHATGPRVGVSGDGGDPRRFPWRLWITGDPTVSAYRPAYRRPTSRNSPPDGATSA